MENASSRSADKPRILQILGFIDMESAVLVCLR